MNTTKKIGHHFSESCTPDALNPRRSRYLWEFLMDPRVVDLPRWKWYPLLKSHYFTDAF